MKHVDPAGLSPGYAHQLGVPLRGGTVWGVISGGVNLRGLFSANSAGVVRATTQVNGEIGNSTPCHAKPLNWSSPKVAHNTRDYFLDIYPHAKFSHDHSSGFFSPCARNYASKMFTRLLFSGFFQRPTAQAPEPIFTQNTSNDVVPRNDVPFRSRKQKFNI